VLISKEEYDALEETAHLLRSPANAARLMRSLADAEAGNAQSHGLAKA
jgi:antitoxin YefM